MIAVVDFSFHLFAPLLLSFDDQPFLLFGPSLSPKRRVWSWLPQTPGRRLTADRASVQTTALSNSRGIMSLDLKLRIWGRTRTCYTRWINRHRGLDTLEVRFVASPPPCSFGLLEEGRWAMQLEIPHGVFHLWIIPLSKNSFYKKVEFRKIKQSNLCLCRLFHCDESFWCNHHIYNEILLTVLWKKSF